MLSKSCILGSLFVCVARAAQSPLSLPDTAPGVSCFYQFPTEIRRVAVIGAGPLGLQASAALIEQGFEVRVFERTPGSGGNWQYSEETPIPASFPTRSEQLINSSYHPDIPSHLPHHRVYRDGEEGVTNAFRLREHHAPSAIWNNLITISPTISMTLPDISQPPGMKWIPNHRVIQRYIRQYASAHALNAGDEELSHVLSYSTRVERLQKSPSPSSAANVPAPWTLTLRKMIKTGHSSDEVRVDWWTEEFDAVVVATGEWDSAWIPPILGVSELQSQFPERVFHSRDYRHPEPMTGKNVLLIGGMASSVGMAADLVPFARSITISVHTPNLNTTKTRYARSHLPANVSIIPEITQFSSPIDMRAGSNADISDVKVTLVDGTVVSGYDYIIFGTGYRRSNPFLVDFHNSTIHGYDEPETRVAPIITDGTHLRSLHWTGHYIDDPTLAIMASPAWTVARYQAIGFARVWAGKARIPSKQRMWATYPGPRKVIQAFEDTTRYFMTWLNNEALELGGSFVEHYPHYYEEQLWYARATNPGSLPYDMRQRVEIPRSKWAVRNGPEDSPAYMEHCGGDEPSRYHLTRDGSNASQDRHKPRFDAHEFEAFRRAAESGDIEMEWEIDW